MPNPIRTVFSAKPDSFFWPGEIIPKPKRAVYGKQNISLIPTTNAGIACSIVLGNQVSASETEAAVEFKRHINAMAPAIRIAIREDTDQTLSSAIVLIIGTAQSNAHVRRICNRMKLKLTPTDPGREGYRLRFISNDRQTVILCGGSDAAGCYFGVQSLKQLCAFRQGKVIIRAAEVDDFPTLHFRGMNIHQSIAACRYLAAAKLNGWVFNQYHLLHRWKKPPASYRAYLRLLCGEAQKHSASVLQVVNPLRSPNAGYGGKDKIRCSSKQDIELLYRTMCLSLDAGSRVIALKREVNELWVKGGQAPRYASNV